MSSWQWKGFKAIMKLLNGEHFSTKYTKHEVHMTITQWKVFELIFKSE